MVPTAAVKVIFAVAGFKAGIFLINIIIIAVLRFLFGLAGAVYRSERIVASYIISEAFCRLKCRFKGLDLRGNFFNNRHGGRLLLFSEVFKLVFFLGEQGGNNVPLHRRQGNAD